MVPIHKKCHESKIKANLTLPYLNTACGFHLHRIKSLTIENIFRTQ